MGVSGSTGDDPAGLTAAEIRAVRFTQAKGFGRGYDAGEVDRTMSHCAELVEQLTSELITAHDEVAELRARLERESSHAQIEHSVNVLTTAQDTADKIIAQADRQRERTDIERQGLLAQAREAAATLQRDSQRRAKQVADEAARKAAALEQDIARLSVAADVAQQEIDREARHLQTIRETSRAQLDEAIDAILDQLAEQYGRAHPLAAQSAISRGRSAAGSTRQAVTVRSRRGLRVAGRSADRWPDTGPSAPAPSGGRASVMPAQASKNEELQT